MTMEALESKWQSLFQKATVERNIGLAVAEEGYYLFAVPNFPEMPSSQKDKRETELHILQSRLTSLEQGLSFMLNKQKEYDLSIDHDYHAWAKDYAGKIDSNEIRAETVVDLAVFLRKLCQLASEQGLAIWRDQQDKKFVEVICEGFRQPVNLYAEVAHMVLSATSMTDEIIGLLRRKMETCRMLLDYFQKFAQIFSGYRVFVGDHHFVVALGEHTPSPGFNYWALLENFANREKTFWDGVSAVKEFLNFSTHERKIIH